MIQFGLVGYGAIGAIRAAALRQTPGVTLAHIVEPVEERRQRAANECRIATSRSLQDLLDNDAVRAVIISTPPHLHREHCETVLRAGKDVLCEKPLAPTPEDCRHMVETARASRRVLGAGFNYRFYPCVVQGRRWIAEGRIGEITHVKSFAAHPGGPEFTHPWVHDPHIVGGGALMDNGIHLVDLTLNFLGEVQVATGFQSNRTWEFEGSEDNGFILMQSPEGRIGSLHATWTEWRGYHWQIEIYGTQGAIQMSYPPMLATLYERPVGHAKRGRRHTELFPLFQVRERLHTYRWTLVQSFVQEQLDFMKRIQGQAGVGATGEDGMRAVELVSTVYRSGHLQGLTAWSMQGQPVAALG